MHASRKTLAGNLMPPYPKIYMSKKEKHTDQFDKRAENLRANLKRRKEQMRQIKEKSKIGEE